MRHLATQYAANQVMFSKMFALPKQELLDFVRTTAQSNGCDMEMIELTLAGCIVHRTTTDDRPTVICIEAVGEHLDDYRINISPLSAYFNCEYSPSFLIATFTPETMG
jgi:hypothetical protein